MKIFIGESIKLGGSLLNGQSTGAMISIELDKFLPRWTNTFWGL
jgi:hypothetical protein